MYASLRKLFHQERRPDSLDILDLLRFLASTWVVLGHRFELNLQVPRLSIMESEKVRGDQRFVNITLRVSSKTLNSNEQPTFGLEQSFNSNETRVSNIFLVHYHRKQPNSYAVQFSEGRHGGVNIVFPLQLLELKCTPTSFMIDNLQCTVLVCLQ